MIGGTRYRIGASITAQAALTARIARGQTDIALGKRLRTASDDPAASARIGHIAQVRTDASAWRDVASHGGALTALADTTLGSVQTAVDRARELATRAASDSTSFGDRGTIAAELRGIADDVEMLGRTVDVRGMRVFPDEPPLALAVSRDERVAPTLAHADAFGSADQNLASLIRAAADAVVGSDAERGVALDTIVAAGDRVAGAHAVIGMRGARLEAIMTRLTDRAAVLAEEQGMLEDTDVAATVARIQADQLSLDASRSLFARVNRQSLFDLLG